MAEATTAAIETKLETPEDLANAIFQNPGPLYAQIALVSGGVTTGDLYFRLQADAWRETGPYAPRTEPLLRNVVRDHSSWRARLSPHLSAAPTTSCIVAFPVVAVPISLPLIQPERVQVVGSDLNARGQQLLTHIKQGRAEHVYDAAVRDEMNVKLRALALPPSVIVDEGSALVALWVLSEPLRSDPALLGNCEQSPYVYTTHRIAVRFHQRADFAHRPSAILVDTPGTQRDDVKMSLSGFTGFKVAAVQLHDQPVAFSDLEKWSRTQP